MNATFALRDYLKFLGFFVLGLFTLGLASSFLPGVLSAIVQSFAGILAAMFAGHQIATRMGCPVGAEPTKRERLKFAVIAPVMVVLIIVVFLIALLAANNEGIASFPITELAIGMPIVLLMMVGSTYGGLAIGLRS